MPDVITGLSMLLLIIQVQTMLQGIFGNTSSFGNGFFTIFLGHATLCMAYITVVIRARLAELDQSLEEAAMDLGARPLKIFFVITLPLIMPAIVSDFLLPRPQACTCLATVGWSLPIGSTIIGTPK